MRWWGKISSRIRALFQKRKLDAQMDEEMRFHLEMAMQANIAAGMSSEEARYAALRKFGSVEKIKETARDERGVRLIEDLLKDIRHGLRLLLKNPGINAVVLLTLALGIGASTAVFSAVNIFILNPVPLPGGGRLVEINEMEVAHQRMMHVSPPLYQDLKGHPEIFEKLASFSYDALQMSGDEFVENVFGCQVTPSFFDLLPVQAELGRLFHPEEGSPDREDVVSYIWQDFRVEGKAEPARLRSAWLGTRENDLFRVLRVPLRQGRFFNETDPAEGARTVLVNESLARLYWPWGNVIGKQLWDRTDAMSWTVVGVVGDFHEWGFDQPPEPTIFQPFERLPVPSVTFFVRTTLDPASFMLTVRREVRETVPNIFAPTINRMEQMLWASTYTRRLYMHFLSAFAAAGLLLAALGVYSVFAYSVARRTREIGIRVALGAQRLSILRLIIGQGVRLILLAIGLGVSASLALTRFLQAQLFGISPIDPLTLVSGCVLLGLVGLLACYIPSRRASKLDPMVALRYE